MYADILEAIVAGMNFEDASIMLENCVSADTSFIDTIKQIGTIPEFFTHDSTEEKLFAKASDAVLSRAFRKIGLKSTVLKEREIPQMSLRNLQFTGITGCRRQSIPDEPDGKKPKRF